MHARRSQNQRFCLRCRQGSNPAAVLFIDLCSSVGRGARQMPGMEAGWQVGGTQTQKSTLLPLFVCLFSGGKIVSSFSISWKKKSFKKGNRAILFCRVPLFSRTPGPFPSGEATPTTPPAPTPNWAGARLWMNEEVQTSLLSSFDVESTELPLSMWYPSPPQGQPSKHLPWSREGANQHNASRQNKAQMFFSHGSS